MPSKKPSNQQENVPDSAQSAGKAAKPVKTKAAAVKKAPPAKPAPVADPSPKQTGKQQSGLLVNRGKSAKSSDPPEKKAGKVAENGQQPETARGHFPDLPIGKGNPPVSRGTQFQKGKSGNPKGYPKGKLNASTIIKYWMGQKELIENPINNKLQKLTQTDIIILQLLNKARKGDTTAARELLDRTEGKPVQSTKLLNASDKLMEISVGFKRPEQNNITPAPTADKTKPNDDSTD